MREPVTIPRRDFLAGFALLGASTAGVRAAERQSAAAANRARPPEFMYVGSFTGEGRGRGEGLSVFRRTGGNSAWMRIQLLDKIADPSFLITDRSGRFIY